MQQDHGHEIARVKAVYDTVYRPAVPDLNYPWHPLNPISSYYRQAQERAFVGVFRDFALPIHEMAVLDVGCGDGGFLRFLNTLGARPQSLHGVDLMPYRIDDARARCPPLSTLLVGNGTALPFDASTFDLISQITMLSAIFDTQVREAVAAEMVRVLKPGGYFLSYDMRKGDGKTTRGIERGELVSLFKGCEVIELKPLHPPRAFQLAKISWLACELWDRVPGLRKTHLVALLRKRDAQVP